MDILGLPCTLSRHAQAQLWSAAKARNQKLLQSLLDYGNDELWAAEDATLAEQEQFERALDGLQPHLSSHWQSGRTLIIRTKIRHLVQLS